jgi:holo-ACP synthase CitX
VKDLALAVKKVAIAVEEGSRLGRLFDIDVLWEEGSVSRSAFGAEPRKCLLCDGDAKVCARSRAHKMEELLAEIDRILEEEGL